MLYSILIQLNKLFLQYFDSESLSLDGALFTAIASLTLSFISMSLGLLGDNSGGKRFQAEHEPLRDNSVVRAFFI